MNRNKNLVPQKPAQRDKAIIKRQNQKPEKHMNQNMKMHSRNEH